MKIAVAQLNPIVGDFAGNAQKIIDAAHRAEALGAEVLLTPELSLVGYPAEDLLLRETFYARTEEALKKVLEATSQLAIHLIVGLPIQRGSLRYNAARLLFKGRVLTEYCKHELPNYDVFDEVRYFEPDNRPLVFELNGINFGVYDSIFLNALPKASIVRSSASSILRTILTFYLMSTFIRLILLLSTASTIKLKFW